MLGTVSWHSLAIELVDYSFFQNIKFIYFISSNKFEMSEVDHTAFPNATLITDAQLTDYMKVHFGDEDHAQAPFRNCSLQGELDSAAAGTGLAFVVFTQVNIILSE